MTEKSSIDFAEREDVKELAERIKLLIPGVHDLDDYMDQGALALAQAALTSGLNPFLGEIWVLRRGRSGQQCKGFSIKPGIKGARRTARNQAAKWGFIPPYYRPMFRVPSDFEGQLMNAKAGDAAVACDLELLLPPDHPWYRDAAGERYTVTGLGIQRSGSNSQMAPFQAARKRAEEDALKLAFDLPIYGEASDTPEAEPDADYQAPADDNPVTGVTRPPGKVGTGDFGHAGPNLRLLQDAQEPSGDAEKGPMPDFSKCGPNYWNNLTRDLQQAGLIPNKAWLVDRFRRMGIAAVDENNAQDLVNQALEQFGDPAPEEPPEEPEETTIAAGRQVDTGTGEILGDPRPLTPAGVTAMVQAKLVETKEKYGTEKPPRPLLSIYASAIGKLTRDPGEEKDLLFYLLFSQQVDTLTRAEIAAFFGWCLEAQEQAPGVYEVNEWAVEEARIIIDMLEARKEQARKAQAEIAAQEAERQARVDQVKANATDVPLPESMQEPEDLEDPPTIQELEAEKADMLDFEAETEAIIAQAEAAGDPEDLAGSGLPGTTYNPFTGPPELDETPEEPEEPEEPEHEPSV